MESYKDLSFSMSEIRNSISRFTDVSEDLFHIKHWIALQNNLKCEHELIRQGFYLNLETHT